MFSKELKEVINKNSLLFSLKNYKNHPDYLMVKKQIESKNIIKQIYSGQYTPQASIEFDIPKHDGSKRTIQSSTLLDKVISKTITYHLSEYFKFSDRSYAYRQNKGPVKAIKRILDDIKNKNKWVLRTDVEAFFDAINQDKLAKLVNNKIKDKQLVTLILLFVKKGSIRQNRYKDHHIGVGQGDPISPFLANLYLDSLDKFLDSQNIAFVRYGDDIIVLGKDKKSILQYKKLISNHLHKIDLNLKEEKTSITNIDYGFEYMGLFIHKHTIRIEKNRLQEKIDTLKHDTKKANFYKTITILNDKIDGFLRYYKRVITDFSQVTLLQNEIDSIIIDKIIFAKKNKIITKQIEFKKAISKLKSYLYNDEDEKNTHYIDIIHKAYDILKSQKDPSKNAHKKIEKKKQQILQSQLKSSELVVGKFGMFLGFSRNKATLKEHGKIVKAIAINRLERIIVLQTCTISTELIYQCIKRDIAIDFIKKSTPFAQIFSYKSPAHTLIRKQIEILNKPLSLNFAKEIVQTKIKNQINLIKYLARYRKTSDKELYQKLTKQIEKMQKIYTKVKLAQDRNQLLGFEGSNASIYWQSFALLIDKPEYQRVTKDAPDAINQALNYAYAIIYHKVQTALIKANLDIYTSIFHTITANKPTLVFDLIEEFRSPIVDREIISIINRGFKFTTNKGRLTNKSVQEVIENIQERLATPTKYHGKKHTLLEIIQLQAYRFANAIKNEKPYHGFTAKY